MSIIPVCLMLAASSHAFTLSIPPTTPVHHRNSSKSLSLPGVNNDKLKKFFSSTLGITVIFVACCVVLIIGLLGLYFWVRKHRKRRKAEEQQAGPLHTNYR